MKWSRHLLIVVASLLLLSACAEERAPINRVQPNVIRKADLDGEWYYQQTVVDMDTSANYSVIGDNAFWNLERVRWDVQENYLYARRAFEWVDNSDATDFGFNTRDGRIVGTTTEMNGRPYMGSTVAAYRISSHFDIRREYNPTTGEEINIIGENTVDRPWSEREYMRVDWSENLATDYDFDYFYYARGELVVDPIPYYYQEDVSPPEFSPVFEHDDDGQLWYFDFVQQLSVHPGTTYYHWWGSDIPTCWLFDGVDCATTNLMVRASFLRTNDDEEDYEAMEFQGPVSEVFGFWTVNRMRYHHREGHREYNRRRFGQVHNIWDRSHLDPEESNDETCSSDADCPGYAASCGEDGTCTHGNCQTIDQCPIVGSRCDTNVSYQPAVCTLPWNETHFDQDCETDADCTSPGSVCDERADGNLRQCTIPDIAFYSSQTCESTSECPAGTECLNIGECTMPYRDRTPKPIVFYATGGWPEDLWNSGMFERLEAEYDWTLARAAAAAMLNSEIEEAVANGNQQGTDEARNRIDNMEVPCQSDDVCRDIWGDWGTGDSMCDMSYQATSRCMAPGEFSPGGGICDTVEDCQEGLECTAVGHCTTPLRQMFYVCHAPVRDDDPEECGPPGRVVRIGDLRYNMLNYSREWNPNSPLGMSPTAPDPLSGRVFGSTVSLYDAVDTVAQRLYEWASLLNGSVDPTDFVNGVDLTHWVEQRETEEQVRQDRTVSRDELRDMYRARNTDWMRMLNTGQAQGPEGYSYEILPELMTQLHQTGTFDGSREPNTSFLHALHDSPIEDMMLNDEVLMFSNNAPGTALTDEVRDAASIASPDYQAWREVQQQWLQEHNWGRNIMYADMYWVSYEELADHIDEMDPEEAFQYIRLRVWESVIVHELGHNLGLYHNFAGSEDTVNFGEDWWSARTQNFTRMPRSRLEQPVTDEEIAGGLNDLGYSSVMDYASNYASGERLGQYDRAAILFGYGRSMEVYRDMTGGLGPQDMREYWSSGGSYLRFLDTGMYALHYTEFYNRMGDDLFNQGNRRILPADGPDGLFSSETAGLQPDLMSVVDPTDPAGTSYTRVPYLYCNDYRADLGENCHRWDFGFDTYDRMQDIITRDDLYYLGNNFRRGRVSSDPERFRNYMYDRQLVRFKLMHDYYMLIDALCNMYYSEQSCEDFFTDTREGYGVYTAAINDGFNFLAQNLTRPDVAYFQDVIRGDGLEVFADTGFYDPVRSPRVELIDGRYFTTSWSDTNYDDDCGVHFWECLHRYGFYINKLLTIMALGEAETFFVARDTAEDIRMWRISYFDDYADQIMDLVGGVMSEDYSAIAPYISPRADGEEYSEMYLRNYADPSADPVHQRMVPEDARPVDPYTGFTVQLYAAVLGYAMMHTNYDNRFATSARMWICGGDHGVEGVPTIRYDDPETGLPYCAVIRPDPDRDGRAGIAQRMLQHANTLKSRTDYCNNTDPEAFDACQSGVSSGERAQAEREMLLYRDQMDIMVHLTARYDNWNFTYGDPFEPGNVPEDW